ncbi:Secoisolariciresinol dehydrogenase [Actinidia chinensis var. chinensis]|uniref:Secoisolariciresinol dehydrogenase n=1 Tax=Actinidia chinensis var. chinensis TaxID=1590841 RepID=A0A2R6QVW1_ACTCC|nr:Secoisolariciresinol dehydrogenase [Actinidia chinensis var. chinensis]
MAAGSFLSAITRRLEGKVAVITGGASGIGKCTAKLFAEHGAKVVIADVQDELGHSVHDEIGQSNCTYVHCDVTNEDHIRNAVDKAVEIYGKLDIMFNNAGVGGPQKARIVDNDKVDFERVLSVNVTGVFLGMKHAARVMIPAQRGTIISTASTSSIIGGAGSHAYCCSKHAVLGLTRNLAIELGQFGIRVNCLSPYGIPTPLSKEFVKVDDEQFEMAMNMTANLKGVTIKADDVAKASLYLASDDAKYISGHNLAIDGGFTVHNGLLKFFQYPQDS